MENYVFMAEAASLESLVMALKTFLTKETISEQLYKYVTTTINKEVFLLILIPLLNFCN